MKKLGEFSVETLGVEYPDYFQGYGLGPSSAYQSCTYGIGDTEEEALDDCLEMMAQTGEFDFTDSDEKRIREAFGACDSSTTVADYLDLDESADDDDGESAWFHVGIKWNEVAG